LGCAPLDVDPAVQTKVIEATSKIKHLSSSKSDKINNIITIFWNGVGARLVVAIEERLKGNVFLDSKQNFKGNVFSKKMKGVQERFTIHNRQPVCMWTAGVAKKLKKIA
jgi:ribosomal protein L19